MRAPELPRAGDLAVVIRWPHPCVSKVGFHFTVGEVRHGRLICERCGGRLTENAYAWTEGVIGAPIEWCRRVPGLSELEAIDFVTELESERPREREIA